jgi:D-alanyl-D-alanine carboxypeptidase/D-alanyl-D-alanine-endopeptidase (penicillin-binding protein 4)
MVGNRYNLITPKQMAIFLTDLYQDKKMYPLFINMLPRMGATGTLKDRMKKSGLENKILAKTGSMHDITALSGYMLLPTGKTIIFSIIGNAITGDYIKAKELEEKILLAVFNNQGKV